MINKLWQSAFGLGILFASLPSWAIPYGTNIVYKIVTETGKTYIYIGDQTPGSLLELTFNGIQRTQVRTADGCGQIKVYPPSGGTLSGNVTVGSRTIDVDSLTSIPESLCTNGQLSSPRNSDYLTPEGRLIAIGFTPGEPQNVVSIVSRIRRIRVNDCGFARFTGTTITENSEFTFNNNNYTVSTIPNAVVGPRCNLVDGVRRGFKPVGVSDW